MEIAAGVLVALLAVLLVAYPLFAKKSADRTFDDDGEVAQEVNRYRAAIKAKTLCDYCLTANAARSNYCSDCGRPL
jgi:hypothetical protein